MDRLTFEGNFCDIAMCQETPGGPSCEDGACSQRKVWERLKAYEDTGMEPEQIRDAQETLRCFDNIGIKRGNEIVTAEEKGRLVILPCKVGDTVWVAGEKRVVKCEIDEAYLDDVKGLEYLVSFNCEYLEQGGDYCTGCPFYSWHQNYSGEWDCDGVWGNASVKGADFGKTVFLTLEEAEAALKGGAAP